MKIVSVVGARPNFMKIAPFIRAIEKHNQQGQTPSIEHILVHTGQHYDDRMSKRFFEELSIPDADINLGIGSGTHAEQVGNTMIALEKVLKSEKPDWVVIAGDINAILAGAITAKKENILCAHIEAGLRSGDMTMPEEINRLVADRLCDLLLTPDKMSSENLRKEGVPEEKIKFVGNIMIDTLEANREKAAALNLQTIINNNKHPEQMPQHIRLTSASLAVLTMHRPSNVDHPDVLVPLVTFLTHEVANDMPLIWSIHPRTEKQLKMFGLWNKVLTTNNLLLLQPLGYHEMLKLNMDARIMLTDSGGLQEECTVLGTPCLTLRWNTERPVTLKEYGGASVLVGNNVNRIRNKYKLTLQESRKPIRPELWDGHTAERCLQAIIQHRS